MQLLRRAARERWDIPKATRVRAVNVLHTIMGEDTFEIERVGVKSGGKADGEEESTVKTKAPNHRNQIAAARTLAVLVGQQQKDEHLLAEWERLDAGLATARVDHTETNAALANPDAIRAAIAYDRAMRKPVANTASAHLNGHLNGHANGHQNGSNGSANGHAPHP